MAYDTDIKAKPAEGESDKKLVERARRCLKLAVNAEKDQRAREREDLRFQIAENQWPEDAREQRKGDASIGSPPRVTIAVSLLKQPMQLVYNQFTRARLGVFIHPVSEKANKEGAEVKQGLYRRIERDGGAQQARGWAFLRALACGRGWYRVVARYDEDADPEGDGAWDQEIAFERILHQENVYVDPAAQKADFSDARWLLVTAWKTLEDFKREFPDADVSEASASWDGWAEEEPDWVRAGENDTERGLLVAEYWYKDIKRDKLTGPDGQVRYKETVTVHFCKLNGFEVLEKQEWDGKYIPFIPVIGEELIPVDGKRVWQGMIRPARDAQMGYNHAISSAVEDVSRVSKTPYIGWAGQFETDKLKWDTLNIKNWPYVEADTVLVDGKPAPSLPQPFPIDGSKLQLSVQMAEQFRGMVQAATAVHEPSLGEMPKRRESQSGRAILALQQQSDAGTSQFAQNLTDITLPYESLVVLDLMKYKYDREARVTSIVTGEDENKAVMLGAPFVMDPNTGQPVEAPGNPRAKMHNLADGKYGVSVSFGKNPQTRMEAGQQFLSEVVQAAPELMDVIGDLLFQFRDEPGAKEIAERLKTTIRSKHPEFFAEKQGGAEQMQAENAALKQQLQMVTQQLQQAGQIIQTKQVEQAAKIEAERIKADTDLKMQELKNLGLITVAQIQAAAKGAQMETEARNEAAATGMELVHEDLMQDKEHAHEREMKQEEMANAAMMGAADAHEGMRPEEMAGGGAE